jgi:hypothetical protein
MFHRFMEIISDIELSHRFIALNNFSIPGDKSTESQKDILDDDLLLLLLLSLSSLSHEMSFQKSVSNAKT